MSGRYRQRGQQLAATAERLDDALGRRALLEAEVERHRLVALIHALLDLLEQDDEPTWFEPDSRLVM